MKYARVNKFLSDEENQEYYVNIKNYVTVDGHGESLESIIQTIKHPYTTFEDSVYFLYNLIYDMYDGNYNILFKNIMKYMLNFCYFNPNTSSNLCVRTIAELMQEDTYSYNNPNHTHIMKFGKEIFLNLSGLSDSFHICLEIYNSVIQCPCPMGLNKFLTKIYEMVKESCDYSQVGLWLQLRTTPDLEDFKKDIIIDLMRKCPTPYNEKAIEIYNV